MHDDDLIDLLGSLDPVGHDAAPEPGSPRYDKILETAMTILEPLPETDEAPQPRFATDASGARPAVADLASRRARRLPRLLVAAAVLAVIAIGALTLRPGGTPSAEAAIRNAADTLADVDSLRAELTITEPDGSVSTSTADVVGDDIAIVNRYTSGVDADGNDVFSESGLTVIDGIAYQSENGELVGSGPAGPNDRLTPFADASAQVLHAALTGADIADLGEADLDGVTVDRYLLTMTTESRAALNGLSPFELAWFELEYPEDISTIEVSVADDLIRTITVTGELTGVRTLHYFDFNAPITLVAPGS